MSNLWVQLPAGRTNICDIAEIAPKLGEDLVELGRLYGLKVSKNGASSQSITDRARKVIRVLERALQIEDSEELKESGLQGLLEGEFRLLKVIRSKESVIALNELVHALKLFTGQKIDERHYGDKAYLDLEIGRVEVTDIKNFSESLYEHLLQVGELPFYRSEMGHSKKSSDKRYVEVVTALRFCINSDLPEKVSLEEGFVGFIQDDYRLLKLLKNTALRKRLNLLASSLNM